MYEIKVTDEFSGAHNLKDYRGKCEELHGHNWRVEVTVYAAALNAHGMVMDFKALKDKLRAVLSAVDHKYLNNIAYFKRKNPTSENIARFIHERLSRDIRKKIRVDVWETANCRAGFYK